jgi:UDP-N-acetylglucosamine 2-epimerase
MSDVFFEELDVPQPNYNLAVGSASHGVQTGKMLHRIEDVIVKEEPDLCLIYGDTNSTLAGALAAVKLHVPVAHVEAGLRSFNRRMPEEINRVVADHISDCLFCPTATAVDNLASEGITDGVYQVGDVMHDCLLFYLKKAHAIEENILETLDIHPKSFYLGTMHRAENTNDCARITNISKALNEIATRQCPVVLPLHPRTVRYARKYGLEFAENVRIVEPVSYLEMLVLEKNARRILTDSGGVQKEAYWLGVPCITLRDETEWVETVESGCNILAGADKSKIIDAVQRGDSLPDSSTESAYGNGDAARQICKILQEAGFHRVK